MIFNRFEIFTIFDYNNIDAVNTYNAFDYLALNGVRLTLNGDDLWM